MIIIILPLQPLSCMIQLSIFWQNFKDTASVQSPLGAHTWLINVLDGLVFSTSPTTQLGHRGYIPPISVSPFPFPVRSQLLFSSF